MPFKYWEMRGWPDSFKNPLIIIVMALDKALQAAHKPLYKHSFRYILCKNANTVHICNIGIHIPWCSIYDPSSEYQFISTFGCRSPRTCDNVSNFWRNACVLECLHNWMANSFIFVYSRFCTDLFYGKVKMFGGGSTGEFTSNFTIMGNQTCFLPWYNHDPWGLFLHYFRQKCSYKAKWKCIEI